MLTTITYGIWQLDSDHWVPSVDCEPAPLSVDYRPEPFRSDVNALEAGMKAADDGPGALPAEAGDDRTWIPPTARSQLANLDAEISQDLTRVGS